MIRGIRGATTISQNNPHELEEATVELIGEIIAANSVKKEDISYIEFTATRDITCAYPAKFVRIKLGLEEVPLMCSQEMYVENSLKMCVRVLMCVETNKKQSEIKHKYLRGASVLRPDIR